MEKAKVTQEKRVRRHKRVRATVRGTAARPRLAVYKSNKHMYAQLINDDSGKTLLQVNSRHVEGKTPKEKAYAIGTKIAEGAKAQKVNTVVFDRGGFIYTGQVKEVAEGARKGGLEL